MCVLQRKHESLRQPGELVEILTNPLSYKNLYLEYLKNSLHLYNEKSTQHLNMQRIFLFQYFAAHTLIKNS